MLYVHLWYLLQNNRASYFSQLLIKKKNVRGTEELSKTHNGEYLLLLTDSITANLWPPCAMTVDTCLLLTQIQQPQILGALGHRVP